MSTKRTVINRQRYGLSDETTLELFKKLELTPLRRRNTDEFKRDDIALAQRLGLELEKVCYVQSVLDREPGPSKGPAYCSYSTWFGVREIRNELLRRTGLPGIKPLPGRKTDSDRMLPV
jgi:hypothetical protein